MKQSSISYRADEQQYCRRCEVRRSRWNCKICFETQEVKRMNIRLLKSLRKMRNIESRKSRWGRNSIVYCPMLVQKGSHPPDIYLTTCHHETSWKSKERQSLLDLLIVKAILKPWWTNIKKKNRKTCWKQQSCCKITMLQNVTWWFDSSSQKSRAV